MSRKSARLNARHSRTPYSRFPTLSDPLEAIQEATTEAERTQHIMMPGDGSQPEGLQPGGSQSVELRPSLLDTTMRNLEDGGGADTPPGTGADAVQQQILLQLAHMAKRMDDMQQMSNRPQAHQMGSGVLTLPNTAQAFVTNPSSTSAPTTPAAQLCCGTPSSSGSDLGNTNNIPSVNNNSNTQFSAPPSSMSVVNHKPFELPEFSGLPEQWPVFIASFRQSTAAFNYSALQNVFRLQKCLKGEAREAVQYLLISPDNVDELIQVLHFRFGRPEILAQSQMNKVREIPEISERAIEQLVTFSSRVLNMVAFLNNNESRHLLQETTLLTELAAKLPMSKRMEWAQHSVNIVPRPNLLDFSNWLKSVAQCVTLITNQPSSASFTTNVNSRSNNNNQHTGQQRQRPNRHVLLSVAGPSTRGVCAICTKPHKTTECEAFRKMTTSDRWAACRRHRLCFGCLKGNHMFDSCRGKRSCPVSGCTFSHHEMLHTTDEPTTSRERENSASTNEVVRASNNATTDPASTSSGRVNVFAQRNSDAARPVLTCVEDGDDLPLLFRVVPVKIHGPDSSVEILALFDEGSSVTILDAHVADSLRLTGAVSNLHVQWIGGQTSSEQSREVDFNISGQCGERFELKRVRTMPNLNLPAQSISRKQLHHHHQHLRGLPFAEYSNAQPKLLIGLDHCHLGVPTATRVSTGGGPIAANTRLGWVVYGPQMRSDSSPIARLLHISDDTSRDERYDQLAKLVAEYFTTENFGVMKPEGVLESDDNTRARAILHATTTRIGERFQTGLLWRSDNVNLPDSYTMASHRLEIVERKMRRNPAYGKLYDDHISAYVNKGYAKKLTTVEASVRSERTWYLPHFGVQPANKPGKFRLVFDAAASVRGTSLNSVLLKGPDLNQPLTTILFQFRMRIVGVCADISEMFHQVVVRPEDRQSQRFLWGRTDGRPDVYEMCVMTFGATCSPTAAQFVKNMNAAEHESMFPKAAEAIRSLHYVDDFVASFDSEHEATKVTHDVIDVHKRGGFVLRGVVSNRPAVQQEFGDADGDQSINMQLDSQNAEKILGMRWCTRTDQFEFAMRFDRVDNDVITGVRCPTKREILSAAMSVFDPFGFIANFMLPAKLIVQQLWRAGITWDVPIPAEINEQWRTWCRGIELAKQCRVPRCYSVHMTTATNIQLHIFADASVEAFAAVGYWRIQHGGHCELTFIIGKTKCAPMKTLSVPRLELQAAVLAVRLCNAIRESHPVRISKVCLWTDSRTVLQWIRSTTRRFPLFVTHRVAEILRGSGSTWWQWLPTKLNVADDATRARMNYDPDGRWLRGPAFLMDDEQSWPMASTTTTDDDQSAELLEEELRPKFVGIVIEGNFISFDRFSSFHRLCRAVGWLRRFINNTRAKGLGKSKSVGELGALEVQSAIDTICRIVQRSEFASEYVALKDGKPIDRSSSILRLMPYLGDDDLIRLYGRTDAADTTYLPSTAQRPILLPHSHRFSKLIVAHHHHNMGHQLEDATICAVRQKFWMPNLRLLVRNVKRKCMSCKIRAASPNTPVAGQLPIDRLQPYVFPFAYTGMDYFGPVAVTVGRRHEKRWVALFTCLTTRAVHLEIAADLSTDACLLCLRNFINLRGVPTRIRSDCGTNFVGADKEIRRLGDFFDVNTIQRELSTKGTEWLFNCPANPEAGGAWERLVQSTKRVLAVTLKEAAPRVETLRCLLIEAANILNSRPLTHVPVSSEDLDPITPNHFLLGRPNCTTAPGPVEPNFVCTGKQFRIGQQLKNRFWSQWISDYLPELTRRTKHHKDVRQIRVGDLVLVCDTNVARCMWARGRISSVVIGRDGRIRTAEVRTNTGVLRRPVSKLAILDVIGELPDGQTHRARDVAA